jgi:hypothetical protein
MPSSQLGTLDLRLWMQLVMLQVPLRKTTPSYDLVVTSVCNQVNQINSKISLFLNTLSTFNSGVEEIAAVCTVLRLMIPPHISFDL